MKATRREALQLIGLATPGFLTGKLRGQATPQTGGQQPLAAKPPANAIAQRDKVRYPLRPLRPDEAVFFNSDHSPIGAIATLMYGAEGSGGIMMQTGGHRMKPMIAHEGILVAVKDGRAKAQVLPFCPKIDDPSAAEFSDKAKARRVLRACVDAWDTGLGVSWTHCTPYWRLPEIDKASRAEMARFLLPATWMTFKIDNSKGAETKSMLFSLLDKSPSKQAIIGTHHGFLVQKEAVTVDGGISTVVKTTHGITLRRGIGKLLSAEQAREKYGVGGAVTPVEVEVSPGKAIEFTLIVSHFNDQALGQPDGSKLYLTKFFPLIESVVLAAIRSSTAAIQRAKDYQAEVETWGLNDYRKFLYGHALASYMFNTRLFVTDEGDPLWNILEGEYNFINTFDLTVDQVFMELAMHPWTVRNELDLFATRYHYTDQLEKVTSGELPQPGGLTFNHDMGIAFEYKTPQQIASPNPIMSQEELQNWILCAGLYWKTTGDDAWLKGKRSVVEQCLRSMQLRDDVDPAKRDGVTTYTTFQSGGKGREITTYDSVDQSLNSPIDSIYIATRSFGCYLLLEALFRHLEDQDRASESQAAAALTAKTISSHFDRSTNSFPARFGGQFDARVIPAIEGLAYPYVMGLSDAVSPTGPYGELIKLMGLHMDSILKPGICIDETSGCWKMSSTTVNTWESKIYLGQFVTEVVLGIKDDRTQGKVDSVHYAIQVLGNYTTAWTDQINSDIGDCHNGSRHYPRGVTAHLWGYKAEQKKPQPPFPHPHSL